MKTTLLLLLSINTALAGNPFPRAPELSITPGSLCEAPTEHRYPEQIAYCKRDVSGWDKEAIFIAYRNLGYSLSGDRGNYKIDHFIPLCAGGSNDATNLWPQYFTISKKTDPVEPLGCEVLSKGKITQKELIDLVMKAKLDITQVPDVMKYLRKLNK